MTLAAIILFAISAIASPLAGAVQQSAADPTSAPTQSAPQASDQAATPQTQNPPAETKPSTSAPSKKQPSSTAKRPHHKKKTENSNCGTLPASPSTTSASNPSQPSSTDPVSAAPPDPSAKNEAPQAVDTSAAPKPCPPKKTIVSHGGTSEPSIQLAGGPGNDQAARQRDVVNQLLGVTDRNLKGIAGQQLSSSQQDTVSQIRQFMGQSKAAVAAGDLDRARTLAWKAETLSEDLVKPQK